MTEVKWKWILEWKYGGIRMEVESKHELRVEMWWKQRGRVNSEWKCGGSRMEVEWKCKFTMEGNGPYKPPQEPYHSNIVAFVVDEAHCVKHWYVYENCSVQSC